MPISKAGIRRSVVFQIFLAMVTIVGMALVNMGLSVIVTLNAQNDAEAINLSGSLRMQSYRISNTLNLAADGVITDPRADLDQELAEFSRKLEQSIIPKVIESAGNTPLKKSYDQVLRNWRDDMAPLIEASRDGEIELEESYRLYNEKLHDHVADINAMVTQLQRDNEGKIELLGMTEALGIILILFIVLFLMMRADSTVVIPLRNLLRAAETVESGDLSYRVRDYPENELGVLATAFNNMTESLEHQYRTLEEQVANRTEELHRSNQALYFLYKTSREISSSPYDQRLLRVFLDELKKVAGVERVVLCINAEPNFLSYDRLSSGDLEGEDCTGNCAECDKSPEQLDRSQGSGFSIAIENRTDCFGFFYIKPRADERLLPWQRQLLTTVAETLSTAFAFHRTLGQEHRVMLLEERSTIARELHDSLAQSLSYMKMETSRLKKLIAGEHPAERIDEALNDLQEGINAAYKHLRELLVTFRVKLDAPNLQVALEHAVEEFAGQSEADVRLDYRLEGTSLGPNGDIHVLHVVREALNNAVKHSGAQNIVLHCIRENDGSYLFDISDDGIGIPDNPEREHHYGLFTMRERAKRLNGTLQYSQRESGGTSVQLRVAAVDDPMTAQAIYGER